MPKTESNSDHNKEEELSDFVAEKAYHTDLLMVSRWPKFFFTKTGGLPYNIYGVPKELALSSTIKLQMNYTMIEFCLIFWQKNAWMQWIDQLSCKEENQQCKKSSFENLTQSWVQIYNKHSFLHKICNDPTINTKVEKRCSSYWISKRNQQKKTWKKLRSLN